MRGLRGSTKITIVQSVSVGAHMKRIALCLDGTWNDNRAGSTLTNVAKLHHAILGSDPNGVRQIAHYVIGIASTVGETAQFLKGAVGLGVGDRIRRAYELLSTDYEPGDEVFLFGFSRGAFEARSLGGFITLFGVAKSVKDFPFDKAWSLYRTRAARRSETALAEVRGAAHYPVSIKCVGVWDTVGNIGNPFSSSGLIGRMVNFHDTRLSENIDVGLHALSIDEVRGPFRPALWSLPKHQALPQHQHVEQVWFAGTHADVGGGFRETGLSDVALLWMAQQVAATTGLAFDVDELAKSTRPDPLGAQHTSATGSIFRWSRLFPFVRLVKQAMDGISPLRRMLFGSWRTSKIPNGHVVVNESIHDSVLQRLGQKVIELRNGRSRMIGYRPTNLLPVVPDPPTHVAQPAFDRPRRVKVFTVHGTFAHETEWDNWDAKDDPKKEPRAFINRLATHLSDRGIVLEELDHTEYNWSGGNSHDERRVAAIGLKKLIQDELSKTYEGHGQDYYDKVFIIAHSHGGTISRLAMNLWDKEDDYYNPVRNAQLDELKHDDECPTCLRTRNGMVGRNSVRRPDGVITFGSPFVSFEPRSGGLLAARLSTWVFRFLLAIPFAALIYLVNKADIGAYKAVTIIWGLTLPFLKTILLLLWPLALYWLISSYLSRMLDAIERWLGKNKFSIALNAIFQTVKYLLLAGVIAYYLAYVSGGYHRILDWLPWSNTSFQNCLGWAHLLTVTFFVLVAVPGSFLLWLRREVVGLREKLPIKYDPAEDRAVAYVSYHTPGDEAGVHLRAFGVLTWVVQTLALSAASVLSFGIVLAVVIGVESLLGLAQGGGLLNRLGFSAVSDLPEYRDRFIALMDTLTYLPKIVWADIVGAEWLPSLGSLENRREAAWFIPIALVLAILIIFLFLMPFVVLAIAVAYLASMWLRGSGVVFGSEKLSWNLANRITVMRLANENTALRLMFISPEAWWRREIAHSYYYKSSRVIRDVADRITDWGSHTATRALPVEAWLGSAARLVVVLLFVLSIFAVSVPIAGAFTSALPFLRNVIGLSMGEGPGSQPEPKDASGYNQRANAFRARHYFDRALADHAKAMHVDPDYVNAYNDRGVTYEVRRDYDLAIADYTKAIALDPNRALFVDNRGRSYCKKGDYDRAIADHNKAIELSPDYTLAYLNRGNCYYFKGDANSAIADYTKITELEPNNSNYVLYLGIARYRAGDFNGAARGLWRLVPASEPGRSGSDNGASPEVAMHAALFRYLARTRAGEAATADLEETAGALKSKDWPYVVSELYSGKRSPAATLGVATNSDQRCEAQFHIGQWHILKGNTADAARALQMAVGICEKTSFEYGIAVDDMNRLSR